MWYNIICKKPLFSYKLKSFKVSIILQKGDLNMYSNVNLTSSISKVLIGQVIDSYSPEMGIYYHLVTTVTATNELDFQLGLLGLAISYSKTLTPNSY